MRRPTGLSGSDALRGSEEGGSQFDIVTVPELIKHPNVGGFTDPPSASQPMQNTGSPEIWRMIGWAEKTAWISNQTSILRDSAEAIVVGAVGSAAPWFLTGWAEGVEVDFMIDT